MSCVYVRINFYVYVKLHVCLHVYIQTHIVADQQWGNLHLVLYPVVGFYIVHSFAVEE